MPRTKSHGNGRYVSVSAAGSACAGGRIQRRCGIAGRPGRLCVAAAAVRQRCRIYGSVERAGRGGSHRVWIGLRRSGRGNPWRRFPEGARVQRSLRNLHCLRDRWGARRRRQARRDAPGARRADTGSDAGEAKIRLARRTARRRDLFARGRLREHLWRGRLVHGMHVRDLQARYQGSTDSNHRLPGRTRDATLGAGLDALRHRARRSRFSPTPCRVPHVRKPTHRRPCGLHLRGRQYVRSVRWSREHGRDGHPDRERHLRDRGRGEQHDDRSHCAARQPLDDPRQHVRRSTESQNHQQ